MNRFDSKKTSYNCRERGVAYLLKGDHDQAIIEFTKAITIDQNDSEAYSTRGVVYNNQGSFTQAIADYTKAIEMDPNYANAYYNRGLVHYKQGNYAQAISTMLRQLKSTLTIQRPITIVGLLIMSLRNMTKPGRMCIKQKN